MGYLQYMEYDNIITVTVEVALNCQKALFG